jgi:hypothetical protein
MKGIITEVRNLGTIWQMDVKRGKKTITISGDWRPMSEGIVDAFGSPERAIGHEIEYVTGSWQPTGRVIKKLRKVI